MEIAEIPEAAQFSFENPFPILRLSKEGTITFANQSARPLIECWRRLGNPLPDDLKKKFREILSSGKKRVEMELDCNTAQFSLIIIPGQDGTYLDIFGSYIRRQKPTENKLRESAQRDRDLFENSHIGSYRTTPECRIDIANPALITMLGYSSFEELASRHLEPDGYDAHSSSRDMFK